MTKVDFYILPEDSHHHRHLFACRLVEKAYRLGHDIFIHGASVEQTDQIDQLLWNFRPNSFVPHNLEHSKNGNKNRGQITIGYNHDDHSHHDLLVNLSNSVPDFFSRFDRVSEIVIQDPQVTLATRKNYTFYRERGYQLKSHDLRKPQ